MLHILSKAQEGKLRNSKEGICKHLLVLIPDFQLCHTPMLPSQAIYFCEHQDDQLMNAKEIADIPCTDKLTALCKTCQMMPLCCQGSPCTISGHRRVCNTM